MATHRTRVRKQIAATSIDAVERDTTYPVISIHCSGARYERDERFTDYIFAELCLRLQRAGIPLERASLHILIHHPQWLGARMMWADGMREAVIERVDYDVRERSEYIDGPANEIHDGATEVRENLERDPSLGRKHAVYDEMRAKGLTDYVAWPLYHTLGKRHFVTFATDRRIS